MLKIKKVVSVLLGIMLLIPTILSGGNVYAARQNWYGTCTNGTGTCTGSPITLSPGVNTITVTVAGSFTVYMPDNLSGVADSGTATLTDAPVSLVPGNNTVTTGVTTGTFTVTYGYPDLDGWYTLKGRYYVTELDGTKYRPAEAYLIIASHDDAVIDDATLYIDGVNDEVFGLPMEGVLGAGPTPYFTLWAYDYDGQVNEICIITGIVRYNRDASVKGINYYITGYTIDGDDAELGEATYMGAQRNRWAVLN